MGMPTHRFSSFHWLPHFVASTQQHIAIFCYTRCQAPITILSLHSLRLRLLTKAAGMYKLVNIFTNFMILSLFLAAQPQARSLWEHQAAASGQKLRSSALDTPWLWCGATAYTSDDCTTGMVERFGWAFGFLGTMCADTSVVAHSLKIDASSSFCRYRAYEKGCNSSVGKAPLTVCLQAMFASISTPEVSSVLSCVWQLASGIPMLEALVYILTSRVLVHTKSTQVQKGLTSLCCDLLLLDHMNTMAHCCTASIEVSS